jgi:hypothetical protein
VIIEPGKNGGNRKKRRNDSRSWCGEDFFLDNRRKYIHLWDWTKILIWAYEIADYFRTKKGKPVIFGGFHPTFMPDEASKHADAVCLSGLRRSHSRDLSAR